MSMELISKEAVLKLFATHDGKYLYEAIRDMPSVEQEQKTDVLEQIRAEIEQEYNKFRNMSDKWDERACGLGTALEIIDKVLKDHN